MLIGAPTIPGMTFTEPSLLKGCCQDAEGELLHGAGRKRKNLGVRSTHGYLDRCACMQDKDRPELGCLVSFQDREARAFCRGQRGPVYEAAALGLQAFRASEMSGYVRPGKTTRLVVTIRRLEAQHEVRVSQLEDWLASGGRSPREQVLKGRLRKLLGLR